MRHAPNLRLDPFRLPNPGNGIVYRDNDGHYLIPHPKTGARLTVIASTGLGWDHVSVSLKNRTPTWEEMDFIYRLFFRDDETVMQLHVPASTKVNLHNYCLHLWRPTASGISIPTPDPVLV
jgi:hypothetical protein